MFAGGFRGFYVFIMAALLATEWLMPTGGHKLASDVRLVVPSKSQAHLPCRVDFKDNVISYTWFRGEERIGEDGDGRIEALDGFLVLRDTRPEDSGVYVCQALRDEDTAEVNVTLIVLVPDAAPSFSNMSTLGDLVVNRSVGSSVRMRCLANGNPRPQVRWFKNDVLIEDTDLSPESLRNRWFLQLRNLRMSDSGNYTCMALNRLGSVNATFSLEVTDGSRPDLAVSHPLNTTVKFGSSATFQCRVRSDATPNIQWLKRIDDPEELSKDGQEQVMKVQGENYRVLKSSDVQEKSDGSFLNKLVIPEAHESDSGKYICLGANTQGYSFRSAFLTVLPRPKSLPLGWSRSISVHPGHPSSLLVAIPITLGVLVGVLVALVVLCHRRRLDTPLPTTSSRRLEFRNTSRNGCDFATTALDTRSPRTSIKAPAEKIQQEVVKEKVAEEQETEITAVSEVVVEASNTAASPSTQAMSEVELVDNGAVVTKLCQQQATASSSPDEVAPCDGCFVLRDEV